MCCFLSNRITGRSLISTPFYLGVADQNIEILPKINIYIPSKQNIFLFEITHQADIPKEAVRLVPQSLEVASIEAILLNEEVFEGMVNVFREAWDLCIEGDDNDADFVTEETDCFHDDINGVVSANSIVLSTACTSWGWRTCIRPPARLEYYCNWFNTFGWFLRCSFVPPTSIVLMRDDIRPAKSPPRLILRMQILNFIMNLNSQRSNDEKNTHVKTTQRKWRFEKMSRKWGLVVNFEHVT